MKKVLKLRTSIVVGMGVIMLVGGTVAFASVQEENRAVNYLPRPNYFAPPMKGQEASAFAQEDAERAKVAIESEKTLKMKRLPDGKWKVLGITDKNDVVEYFALDLADEVFDSQDTGLAKAAYQSGKTIVMEQLPSGKWKVKMVKNQDGSIEYSADSGVSN